jgi:circadian clock protein KaiB
MIIFHGEFHVTRKKSKNIHMKNLINTKSDEALEFEQAIENAESAIYQLRLYVAGTTPYSVMAIANIKKICEEYLKGRYELEVIDLYQNPTLAKGEQIIAAPTLIKRLPLPLHRIIGDLSAVDRVLVGLDLRKAKAK